MRICKRYPDRSAATEYDLARPFPIVTLRGRWLEVAGFQIGDRIQIAVTPGRLVITHAGTATDDL
ncbi:MAG TPA: SymE family type I addiction module toxin [Thermoanaerobaculia bacterium]|nr:SymE family type I addiction module toxin [Thermoanaerobaculia bacterium]